MKKVLFVIGCILSTHFLVGQTPFLDSIYSKIDTSDHTFQTKNNVSLPFQMYRPSGIADTAMLPLVVYVHGGAFVLGSHDEEKIQVFCHRLASRGYAVASVEYRLTMKGIGLGCRVTAKQKVNAFNEASYDIGTAIQYILERKEAFRIDSSKVILIGTSAGAETVLNMAYVYDNPMLDTHFRFAGVIGMAGAIPTLEKIDSNAVPGMFFHGTKDPYVPYDYAPHHYCKNEDPGYLMLHGSASIANKLKGLGVTYYLYTSVGGYHRWAGVPMQLCLEEIMDFLYFDIVNPQTIRQTERTVQDF